MIAVWKGLVPFVILLVILTWLIGCGKEKKEEPVSKKEAKEFKVVEPQYDTSLPGEEGIKNTIKAYNEVLAKVHIADPYLPVLRKYATDKATQRVFIESNFNTENGIVMRSRLLDVVFDNISASTDKSFVDTTEDWDFDYIDIKTKNVVEPRRKVQYKLRYTLEREGSRWVVSVIKELQPRVYKAVN